MPSETAPTRSCCRRRHSALQALSGVTSRTAAISATGCAGRRMYRALRPVEEEGAVKASLRREAHQGGKQDGKRRISEEVAPEVVAPALDGEQAELEDEQVLADDDVYEERDRHRRDADHHHRAVEQPAAVVRHQHGRGNRERDLQQQDRERDGQRGGQPREEDAGYLLARHPALAEIEADDLAHEDSELRIPGLVEPELAPDGVDLLLARHLARQDLRRVAAEELEQEENEQDDPREGRDHLPKPA